VTGTGFLAGEQVGIFWDNPASAPMAIALTQASGLFTTGFTVPQAHAGRHSVIAVGQTSGISLSGTITVKPAVFLVPPSGRAGSSAYLVGAGFGVTETVVALWNPGQKLLGSAQATTLGTVVLKFTVPISATGTDQVIGYGLTTRQFGQAPFTVTTSASQPARGSPTGRVVSITWESTMDGRRYSLRVPIPKVAPKHTEGSEQSKIDLASREVK
jgi:hypothetical protein